MLKAQAGECGNLGGHLAEDILDHGEAIGAADGEDQVAQDFPVVARFAGRVDGAIEALEPALDVDHRAALLGPGAGGQEHGGVRGSC